MRCLSAIVLAAFASYSSIASTNLLPGLRFYQPSVKLGGSLVFLHSTNSSWLGTGNAQAYEFALQKQSLRVIASCPGGDFYPAKDGKAFCVLHGANIGWGIFGTNAFLYSDRLHLSRQHTFDQRPSEVVVSNNQVTFGFPRRSPILADIETGSVNAITGEGTDHAFRAPLADFHHDGWRAPSGKWIFFVGDDPLSGTKLVSSPLVPFDTRYDDPKGKNVRTLKRFMRPLSGSYNLHQMSPCGGYVFIRRSIPIGDSWRNTYYIVNATNGATQLLLEDKVSSIGERRVSYLHWVDENSSGR